MDLRTVEEYFSATETQLGFLIQSRIENDVHENEIRDELNIKHETLEKIMIGDLSLDDEQQYEILMRIALILNIKEDIEELLK